ncbi:MAG: hypothetical protein ACRENV_08855, partial [Candidatus Dormibacteria bacterium]
MLDLVTPLDELFPERGLRPGTVVAVGGRTGSTSLLLGLLAGPLSAGSWGAVVGVPGLGAEAAAKLGVNLEHLALVPLFGPAGLHGPPEFAGARWPEVAAVLLDGLDVVALRPPGQCPPSDARRLAARAREARSVLLLAAAAQAWPEPVDIELVVTATGWHGLEAGHGALAYRTMEVRSSGRRGASRERRVQLLLPAPGGG